MKQEYETVRTHKRFLLEFSEIRRKDGEFYHRGREPSADGSRLHSIIYKHELKLQLKLHALLKGRSGVKVESPGWWWWLVIRRTSLGDEFVTWMGDGGVVDGLDVEDRGVEDHEQGRVAFHAGEGIGYD